jgi:hypothetical protein
VRTKYRPVLLMVKGLTCNLEWGRPNLEEWIKGSNIEFEETFRALFDQLANLITVAWALLNKREDKSFCATLLQFSFE